MRKFLLILLFVLFSVSSIVLFIDWYFPIREERMAAETIFNQKELKNVQLSIEKDKSYFEHKLKKDYHFYEITLISKMNEKRSYHYRSNEPYYYICYGKHINCDKINMDS